MNIAAAQPASEMQPPAAAPPAPPAPPAVVACAVLLLGVPVDPVTLDQAAEHVVQSAKRGVGGWVITPNLDILRRTVRDAEFRRMYDQATLRLADGMPLVWASRLKGTPLPERVAGSDLIFALAAKAAQLEASIFLLGGNPGAAEQTAAVLRGQHPGIKIAGIACPPLGFEHDTVEMTRLIAQLRAGEPQLVLVALGSPKQERLIELLRTELPRAWFLGIGITFSFVAGEVKRAPMWMRRTGLEWTHRLVQEPRRLVRRYLVDGLPFALKLFLVSASQGLSGGKGRGRTSKRESNQSPERTMN